MEHYVQVLENEESYIKKTFFLSISTLMDTAPVQGGF